MLHILWILLKFILILLGILLGLILVAVLLILFCPVRYRASGTKETDSFRDISARARVSWLFGVVSFQLQYQNGTSAFDFRLFGIPIMKLIQKFRNRSHPAEKKPQNGHTDSLPANTEKSTNSTDFKDVSTAGSCRSTNEASDLTEETVASERDTDLEYARTKIGHLFYRLGIFFRNLWNRLSRLWQKICRIPSSVENFTLTIQNKSCVFSHKGQVFPVASACISNQNTGHTYFWKLRSICYRSRTCNSGNDDTSSQKLHCCNTFI